MRSSLKIAIAVFSGLELLLLPSRVSAQQPTELPGIYVQGATLGTPQKRPGPTAAPTGGQTTAAADSGDAGGVPLDKIGSAVTVVTGDQLRAQQVRHAGDALRSLPGVNVSTTGGPAGPTQVRLRGAEGNHTLVMIDGIEANATAAGEFDFAHLMTDDIERIEVIRGPQSGLYGSKAIGGVINIITKDGKGPFTASVRTEGGAYGTAGVSGRVSGGNDKAWIAASVTNRSQQYFNIAPVGSEQDPSSNLTVSVKGGVKIMNGLVLDYVVRNTNRRLDTDPEGLPPGATLNRAIDVPNKSKQDLFLGGVNLTYDSPDGSFTQVLRTNRSVTDIKSVSRDFFGIFQFSENLSETNKLGYLATYRFATPMFLSAKHSLSGLVERELESFRPVATGPFAPDGIERDRNRLATVGEYRGEFFDRLVVTGALRHDDNDSFLDYTTWRTTVSLSLKEVGLRPHASLGTAVALPGMFEQFGSVIAEFIGNSGLRPERSRGWDAGVEFTLVPNRAFLDVTYFKANLIDEITPTFDPILFVPSVANLPGVSERRGVEVALRTQLVPSLYFGAAYTFLDATEPSGAQEIRRPRNSGRLDLTYLFDNGRGTFNTTAAYNGAMKDGNFVTFPATIVTLDDYLLVSAALSYKLQPGVELFGRVENLLNQNYQEISGYNTPGIAAFGGIKLTYGGPEGFGMPWKK